MTWESPQPPSAEQLTAYHDGELEPIARAAIAAWLRDHPETAAVLSAWRRIDAAWRDTRVDEPRPAAWDTMPDRIAARIAAGPRRTGGWWLGVGAAAAIFVALGWAFWPTSKPKGQPEPEQIVDKRPIANPDSGNGGEELSEEPLEIAPRDRIQILCMDGNDTYLEIDGQRVCCILGGEPPIPDDEIRPTSHQRTKLLVADGGVTFGDERGWPVPILVDPVVLAPGWKP